MSTEVIDRIQWALDHPPSKETQDILDNIEFELSKLHSKSKNKMTNEQFRAFFSEQWELMDDDKYTTYGVHILVGRMQTEAIHAKDAKDLIKWIKEDQKMTNFFNNSLEIKYNYYMRELLECGAFVEGLAFFQEQNTTEAQYYVNYFQDLINHPEKMQAIIQSNEDIDDIDYGYSVTLEQWSKFFNETVKLDYTLLRKDGKETDRHSKQHRAGLKYIEEHQQEILETFLKELLKIYPDTQERYADFLSEQEKAEFMPDVSDISGFAPLLSPVEIYIFSEYVDDLPYYGIGFSCDWETEHGLGVIMHKNRVVKLGDMTDIFDVYAVKDDVKSIKKKKRE